MSEPVTVYARWAGYFDGHPKSAVPSGDRAHVYSASILPEQPLKIGMRVRLLATTPAWYYTPEEDADVYDVYDVYDAHIVGPIIGVVGWKGRKVVLEIQNECGLNPVKKARIRIPFVPEATVQLEEDVLPIGRREAFEEDLNTTAVVRIPTEIARCGADTCSMPWRRLVGEDFLSEPMTEDVGEPPWALGGRRKRQLRLIGWSDVAGPGVIARSLAC